MTTKKQKMKREQELNPSQHVPVTDASSLRVSKLLVPPSETILFALINRQPQQAGLEEIAFTTEAILTLKTTTECETRSLVQMYRAVDQIDSPTNTYKAIDRYDYAAFQFSPVRFDDQRCRCFDISFQTEKPLSLDGDFFHVRMRDEATARTYYKATVALLRETKQDFFKPRRALNFRQAIALIGDYGMHSAAVKSPNNIRDLKPALERRRRARARDQDGGPQRRGDGTRRHGQELDAGRADTAAAGVVGGLCDARASLTNPRVKAPTWFSISPAVRDKWLECIPIGTNLNNLFAARAASSDVDANVFQMMQLLVLHHRERWGNEVGDTTSAAPSQPAATVLPKVISMGHSSTELSSSLNSSQPKAIPKNSSDSTTGGANSSASASTAASAVRASPSTSTALWTRDEILTLLRVWREAVGSCHFPTDNADFGEVVHVKFCVQYSTSNSSTSACSHSLRDLASVSTKMRVIVSSYAFISDF